MKYDILKRIKYLRSQIRTDNIIYKTINELLAVIILNTAFKIYQFKKKIEIK